MRVLAVLIALGSAAAAAETPLSGEEFDAYTQGRVLSFSDRSGPYGAEEYLPGRRVRWSFLDGQCKDGIWYPEDGQICFVYEDRPDPQCWRFYEEPGGLRAVFEGSDGLELYEAQETDALMCLGPDVGV